MNNKLFVILFAISVMLSCNTATNPSVKGVVNIDLSTVLSDDDDDVALEDIIESIDRIIPLQTEEGALVDEIIGYLVTDEYIYILDMYEGRSVVIFNNKGEFVTRIRKGNGPGEINFAQHLFYDYENDRLFIQDFVCFMEYSKDGKFLQNYPIDYQVMNGSIEGVQKTHDGFLATVIEGVCDSKIIRFDTNMTVKWEIKLPHVPFELSKYVARGVGGRNWIIRNLDNNLYNYSNDSIEICHLDLGDYEYSDVEEYEGDDPVGHLSKLIGNINKGKYLFYSLPLFCESEDYLSFSLITKDSYGVDIYYHKDTKSVFKTKHIDGSLMDVVYLNRRSKGDGNVFYGIINAERLSGGGWNWDGHNPNGLLSDSDMAVLKNVKLDDNPIIVIYTLKKDV